MRFLFYFFIAIASSFLLAQANEAITHSDYDLSECAIDEDDKFVNSNIDARVKEDCVGFWPNAEYIANATILPLCRRNSDYSLQYGQIPRKNCHDLIHLPLCRDVIGDRIPGITCVNECKDLNLNTIKNMPNYGHNYYKKTESEDGEIIGCIRFCDEPIRSYGEDIELKIEDKECVRRMCHQYLKYDLTQFPLCKDVDIVEKIPGKTCIHECKDLTLNEVEDMPNYGHNHYELEQEAITKVGCVRFCDDPEKSSDNNEPLTGEGECSKRPNCQKMPCNLLYKYEMSYKDSNGDVVLREELPKYGLCENKIEMFKKINNNKSVLNIKNHLKCYDFAIDKLPLVGQWLRKYDDEFCNLHSCYVFSNYTPKLDSVEIGFVLEKEENEPQINGELKNTLYRTSNDICPFQGDIANLMSRCNNNKYYLDNNCEDDRQYLKKYIEYILNRADLSAIKDEISSIFTNDCGDCIFGDVSNCNMQCSLYYKYRGEEDFLDLIVNYEILGSRCDNNSENDELGFVTKSCKRKITRYVYIYDKDFTDNYKNQTCPEESMIRLEDQTIAQTKDLIIGTQDNNYDDININNISCSDFGLMPCVGEGDSCSKYIDRALFGNLINIGVCNEVPDNNGDCRSGIYNIKEPSVIGCYLHEIYSMENRNTFKCLILTK